MKNFDVFFGLLLIPFVAVWQGLILKTLWGWFMSPIGVPGIDIPTAIGLSLLSSMLVGAKSGKDKSLLDNAVGAFLSPLALLGMAWIVHLFQ